jgi:hypothetical protein
METPSNNGGPPTVCKECGKEISYHYMEPAKTQLRERGICFHCNCFYELLGKNGLVILREHDGRRHHYMTGGEGGPAKWKGFGGQKWIIQLADGKIIETTNLWHQGEIPAHFYDRFPINAKIITEDERRRLAAEGHKP